MRLGPVDAGNLPTSATVGLLTLARCHQKNLAHTQLKISGKFTSVNRPTVADAGNLPASIGPKRIDVESLATPIAQAVDVDS